MKIIIIGEQTFNEKLKKALSEINVDMESIDLNVNSDEVSYQTLLYYYGLISSFLDGFVQEDRVLCFVGLDFTSLDFESMPYIHLAYERKHELLSLYFYELLLARLILSYPEVWWVFIETFQANRKVSFPMHVIKLYENRPLKEVILEKLFLCSYTSPLFDIDGLYEYLLNNKFGKDHESINKKRYVFYIFEEELDYVFYMFYTLSEFRNVKVYPLHLYTLAVKILKEYKGNGSDAYECYIHDRYYYPVDLPFEKKLENLKERVREFRLKTEDESTYVSHILVSFSEKKEEFIKHEIRKPLKSLDSFVGEIKEKLHLSELEERSFAESKEEAHSSKGVFSEIATKIIRRAETYYGNINSAEEAFEVAIMARYALDILESKNLNLLYKAFSLKMRAESLGEVIFTGSDVNIDVNQKAQKIKKFLEMLKKGFGLDEEKIASLELLLLNELLNIYKEHNQLEEELTLTHYIREKAIERKLKGNTSSKNFAERLNNKAKGVLHCLIHQLLIMPMFSFKRAVFILASSLVIAFVLRIAHEFEGKGISNVVVKALIDTLYGLMTANIGGNFFGVFISILNLWFMVIVIGYFFTYIIRR